MGSTASVDVLLAGSTSSLVIPTYRTLAASAAFGQMHHQHGFWTRELTAMPKFCDRPNPGGKLCLLHTTACTRANTDDSTFRRCLDD